MRLITDENIPRKIVKILKARDWDILTVSPSTSDFAIGKIAQTERRIILTMDKDFSNPLTFPPFRFRGIIRIRIHPPIVSSILKSLDALFAKCTPEDLDGKLAILEKNGFRFFS